jgi:hypothetical protein
VLQHFAILVFANDAAQRLQIFKRAEHHGMGEELPGYASARSGSSNQTTRLATRSNSGVTGNAFMAHMRISVPFTEFSLDAR